MGFKGLLQNDKPTWAITNMSNFVQLILDVQYVRKYGAPLCFPKRNAMVKQKPFMHGHLYIILADFLVDRTNKCFHWLVIGY